ncbi:MAG: SMR family transporter [Eubacteriales bacterium]|nr:SMR family transporter [Eubacteriales bacterium]
MIYLGLAILSSAMVSTFMRCSEGYVKNNMGMFFTNYIACAALSLMFMGSQPLFLWGPGIGVALGLGLLTGILYLANFVLLEQNIKKNGVVLSATFMKLGVLIPTLMAIFVFRERPKIMQILGVSLAIISIFIIHFEKEERGAATYKLLLIILLICSGFADSTANIYDKLGQSNLKDAYLFYTFAAAALCAFALWIKEKQKICRYDILCGIVIGIPNYLSARFLLLALHQMKAVIVYPVYSVMTLVVISIVSLLFFKEHLSKKKVIAIGLIMVSLALINL